MTQEQLMEDFNKELALAKEVSTYREPIGFGICRVDITSGEDSKVLQANFPIANWGENYGSAALFHKALLDNDCTVIHSSENEELFVINNNAVVSLLKTFTPLLETAVDTEHMNVQAVKVLADFIEHYKQELADLSGFRVVFVYADTGVNTVEAAYLKLYAMSEGKAPIRSLNLDGIFGLLTNCAWIGNKPMELSVLREQAAFLKLSGQYPAVDYVDKFPRMLQHVVPADNTRILDTSKVRMGAQLAAGTTVMPGASYVNFNAGTEGPCMVEGRISSSAIVGAGTDIGGGASILGVLSGTDGDPITVGENCLLGANSVTGIPLGDGCIVDAGLAILPGTKVSITTGTAVKLMEVNTELIPTDLSELFPIKANVLSGMNGVHFRLDSTSGIVTVSRSTKEVVLNADLH